MNNPRAFGLIFATLLIDVAMLLAWRFVQPKAIQGIPDTALQSTD